MAHNTRTPKNEYDETYLSLNGWRFHVILAGPPEGQLLVFLHGFPEFWYGWRHQIDYFASRGYRIVVPDQRGYNLSDKPKKVADYNLDCLASDVIALIDHFQREKAIVIGHDWGAAVAWWVANRWPERVEKLVALNVPHHQVFKRFIQKSWEQKRRSWYMLLFQIPFLAEAVYRAVGARSMRESSRPGTFSEADFEVYRKGWNQPDGITGMFNWYRAALRHPPQKIEDYRIHVPTLMLWGKKDAFLMSEMAEPSLEFCDDGRLVFLDEATHWLQHEFPERVNGLMQAFLDGKPMPGAK